MSKKSKSTLKNIGIVFWVLVLAKIIAFLNDAVLAAYLGTSVEADAFYMVLGIQQVLYPMLSVGIWKVFLPEYKKKLTLTGEKSADLLANKMILLFGGVSIFFAGIIFVFYRQIVKICAPGLSGEGEILCGQLLRISAPLYIFIIVSAVIATMLQCHGKFLGSQIREVVSHIPTIIFSIFLYNRFGIQVLAYSLVLGSILRLVVQFPFIDWGFQFRVTCTRFSEQERESLKKIPEALLTAGVEQINVLIDKMMASGMRVGSISALNYAQKLINVFSGLFANAIGTTLYPQMASLVAENAHQKLEKVLRQSVYVISFMMLPITIGSLFYSETIIACVFQRGKFNVSATQITAVVYNFYAIGLLFVGMRTILSNILYSYGDTKAAMKISLATVGTNVVMNIFLSYLMGAPGLSLASSLAAMLNVIFCFISLRNHLKIFYKGILFEIGKAFIASLVACFISKLTINYFLLKNSYIELIIAILECCLFYILLMIFFKSETIKMIKDYYFKRSSIDG